MVMKNISLKIISLFCSVCFILSGVNLTVLAETSKYAVSVIIISDNITLAQYTVSSPQTPTPEALGGDRAAFTVNESGAVTSITVNGKTLQADGEHNITVLYNGKEIEQLDVKVADGDSFVFRHYAIESTEASSAASSVSADVSSQKALNTTEITSSKASYSKAQSEKTSSEGETSEEHSSENELSSEEAVSSDMTAQTSSDNPNRYEWNDELDKILDDACSWLAVNDSSIMQLIALSAAGQPAKANAVDKFLQNVKQNNGEFENDLQLFYAVLSSTFSGIDAESVKDVNLIQKMIDKKDEYLENPYYAALMLISLDSNGYLTEKTDLRREIVEAISSCANDDGGFSRIGGKSKVGDTAIVLTALSSYKSIASDAISGAITYISGKIKNGLSNTSGLQIAKIITAVNSLELSMDDEMFLNDDNKNLVEVMQDYINPDGGFAKKPGESSNAVATEYFVLALVSLEKGASPYVISYQSRSDTSSAAVKAKKSYSFYLAVIIAFVFAAMVTVMAVLFIYAKKRNIKGFGDSIKFVFENKSKK